MSMKQNKQLSFAMYEASVKFAKDPMKKLFDAIDFSFIYDLVRPFYREGGRESFDPVSLFKALLFIYMDIKIQSERELAKHLKSDMRLLSVCGFEDLEHTPTHGTFSIFRSKIGDAVFFEIFHQLVANAFSAGIISGQITAMDATHMWAYSNKFGKKLCTCQDKSHCECQKTYSDPDATWGRKSKNYSFFGYKVHLIVDAKSQLPMAIEVSTGKDADCSHAQQLLTQFKDHHPDIKTRFNTADAGYDAHDIYRHHKKLGIVPIIDLNTKNGMNPLLTGEAVFKDGKLHCKKGPLYYDGMDRSQNRLKFRCPFAVGKIKECEHSASCCSTPYGRTFYVHPTDNIRLFPKVQRFSKKWHSLYAQRTSIERSNSELKGSHRLMNNRYRTFAKVKIHATMSCCALILKRFSTFLQTPDGFRHAGCCT